MADSPITDTELDADISLQVRQLCQRGYLCFDDSDFDGALRLFYSAWTKLPKPQAQWQEAGWVLTALGDSYFAKGNYKSGKEALTSALHCPQTRDNPIVHLRLGQCLYELNDQSSAARHFNQVYQLAGKELFAKEDPKYSDLI